MGRNYFLKSGLVILIPVLFAACNPRKDNMDCSRFRTGKFTFHSTKTDNLYIIERNDSVQTETNLRTGSTTTASIKWINSCEYELKYLSRQAPLNDTIPASAKSTILRTTIIAVAKDYYVFSS